MENEDKQIDQLSKVLTNMDEWLIRFGYIPSHAHNRVIEQLSKQLSIVNPGDIEYLVDGEQRRVDLTLYLPLWYLLFLFIFMRRDKVLAKSIAIVEEVLAGYEIRSSLARRGSREKNHKLINSKPIDDDQSTFQGSQLQQAQDILSDSEEFSENQQELRDETLERHIQSDEDS